MNTFVTKLCSTKKFLLPISVFWFIFKKYSICLKISICILHGPKNTRSIQCMNCSCLLVLFVACIYKLQLITIPPVTLLAVNLSFLLMQESIVNEKYEYKAVHDWNLLPFSTAVETMLALLFTIVYILLSCYQLWHF